jgi:hypothetical protein
VTDIPTEVLVAGFGGMGTAVALLWRHFQKQTEQVRSDLKERIAALETALGKALAEIKELRHYERDRLFSLADQAHMRERDHKMMVARLSRCANCPPTPAEIDTEALERVKDPPPPRGSSSGFQPIAKITE